MDSQFIAHALNQRIDENFNIKEVSIDSRTLVEGSLFIAIKGEHFDGHDYIEDAVKAGAVAVISAKKINGLEVQQFVVADTHDALRQLAHKWRLELNAEVIGITGSNGKTSVKEMVRAALGHSEVHATSGNFNNLIGLPLTILSAPRNTRFLVLEMGMSIPGEMATLSKIAEPTVVAITNASVAHAEGVGGILGVRTEKAAIMEGLSKDGSVVLNKDDAAFKMWRTIANNNKVVSFGQAENSDFKLIIKETGYQLGFEDELFDIPNDFKGRHNYLNALCAIALARIASGFEIKEIINNLAQYQQVNGRLNFITLGETTLIDDSYNANPASAKAGIDVLVAEQGQHMLILGNMAELGVDAQKLHDDVFAYAQAKEVEVVFGFGDMAAHAADKHGGKGFTDLAELINEVLGQLTDKAVVLIKGSRSMRMERVVEALQAKLMAGGALC